MDIRVVELDNGQYRVYLEGKPVLYPMSKTEAERVAEQLKRVAGGEDPKTLKT